MPFNCSTACIMYFDKVDMKVPGRSYDTYTKYNSVSFKRHHEVLSRITYFRKILSSLGSRRAILSVALKLNNPCARGRHLKG